MDSLILFVKNVKMVSTLFRTNVWSMRKFLIVLLIQELKKTLALSVMKITLTSRLMYSVKSKIWSLIVLTITHKQVTAWNAIWDTNWLLIFVLQ